MIRSRAKTVCKGVFVRGLLSGGWWGRLRGFLRRKGRDLPDGLKPPGRKPRKAPGPCFWDHVGLCCLWWLHDTRFFQLLEQIHKVHFLLHKDTVAFNDNGDPLSSYNIIAWDWNGPKWTFTVLGSSTWSPVQLNINETKIQWHGKDNQVMGMWLLTT